MANESPVYDQCPTHCDTYNEKRATFCESCPAGIARDDFREYCEAELSEMPGPQFGYDYLYRCLIEVKDIGDMPAEAETVTTARLRAIIEAERYRIRRAKDWNKRPPAGP